MDRKSKRTAGFGLLAMSIAFFLATSGASAATLNVVGGQLFGASGVIVAGNLYSVEFQNGSCIDVFDGCNEDSDFTFNTLSGAAAAAEALLDQVFVDSANGMFDSFPALTSGCDNTSSCFGITVFGVLGLAPNFTDVEILIAENRILDASDLVRGQADFINTAMQFPVGGSAVFAVWTPIPEPGTAVLMGLGLLGLGARPRGQRRS